MMDVGATITAAKDIALALAALMTGIVAVRGLANWNRELQGRASFDAARATAHATYALRNAVEQCRSPWINGSEFPPEFHSGEATPDDKANGYAHLYSRRLKPVYKAASAFDGKMLEAEALWGLPIKTCATNVRGCLVRLRAAMEAVVDNARARGENFQSDPKFGRDMRAIVHGLPGDVDNAFASDFTQRIDEIEALLKPYLRPARPQSFYERLGSWL